MGTSGVERPRQPIPGCTKTLQRQADKTIDPGRESAENLEKRRLLLLRLANDSLMSLFAAEKKIRERIAGEDAVLRDLLRDCLPVLETVSDDDGEDWMIAITLKTRIKVGLDGHDADMLSDGQIYAETSRRANPEAHVGLDKLIGKLRAIVEKSSGES